MKSMLLGGIRWRQKDFDNGTKPSEAAGLRLLPGHGLKIAATKIAPVLTTTCKQSMKSDQRVAREMVTKTIPIHALE